MLLCRVQQRPAPTPSAGGREDRHPERQHPGHALHHGRVTDDLAAVVLEHPHRGRIPALEQLAEAPDAVVDVDRGLGAEKVLLGDGGDRARRGVEILVRCSADDHSRKGNVACDAAK